MTQLDTFLSSELGEQAQHVLAEFSEPGVLEQVKRTPAHLLILQPAQLPSFLPPS
jgi:hypothetical protein